jgi:aminopeptidase N
MDLYFQRHDGQAVTCDDFAQAIADANPGSALATGLERFKGWYAQAGTPALQARGAWDADARTYTLTLRQSAKPSAGQPDKQPVLVPVTMGLVATDGRALPLRLAGEDQAAGTERVLVLTEAEQRFVFIDVDGPPVPSLLRGFSAPVTLDDGLDDAALLVLLQHDADAFNRWEAGQRLSLNRLLAALPGDADLPPLDDAYLQALRRMLRDPALDAAFKDVVLLLPSEAYIAECVGQDVNPARIHRLREQLRAQIAAALRDDWAWAFEAHQVREGYRPTPDQAGRRALANQALRLLVLDAVARGDTVWPGRAYQRFKDAGNMTDRMGALVALVDGGSPLAEAALARFHALFAGDDLVIDKWFNLQANACEPLHSGPGTLGRVKALLQHPDFTLKNPNRARSLLSGYCRENPAAFHRADAAGYVFWADRVLELDAINPQLAARLARAMDRWRALAEPWRSAAREAVARVAASPKLSDDVREIVTKALES